ncbi:4Fe-4S binding protein [Desulfovermiculus halophilus]|jgi:NADH-quinone oxidoreductase subunit I|uniref:4Fe-4S binding protein n=1 Tax=Desulfovermiculus halophilus TaxID=339722 RepID=UPI000481BF32|nr:4Fe-4S binding protein [Desulfovermiculus halophilus]
MMVKKFRDTLTGLWSLLVGLKVTAVNFVRPEVTVHYPRQTVPSLEGYRGHIELVPSQDDPFKSKCIVCMTCVRMCPTSCISVAGSKPKKKTAGKDQAADADSGDTPKAQKAKPELESFVVDFTYCSLCGLCVQNCPTGALRFSTDVYLAGFSRQDFVFDLLGRLQSQAEHKEQ